MKSDKGRRAIDTVQAKDCYDPADYVTVHKDYWAKLHRLVERALASSQGKTPEVAPPNEQPRMNYAATKQYAEEMGLPTDFTDPAVSEALKRDADTTTATPRTDAEEQWAEWNGNEFQCVHSAFARELERELEDATADLSATKDTLVRHVQMLSDEIMRPATLQQWIDVIVEATRDGRFSDDELQVLLTQMRVAEAAMQAPGTKER